MLYTMRALFGSVVALLMAACVTSSADNNYHVTCQEDPVVGVLTLRPGKVKGHLPSSSTNGRQCRIGCPRQLNAVCGSDGTTYGNECALCAAACQEHSLYLACQGECPCPVPNAQGRAGTGQIGEGDTADRQAAAAPQSLQQQQTSVVSTPRKNPRKLKKNPNPVIVVTAIELEVASGDVVADTLNNVTLDLHADLAQESNPVMQSSLWVVMLFHKGRGKSPRRGLVHQSLTPSQSQGALDVGQPLEIRGIEYEVDLRGMTCADAAKICAHLKHQRVGKRRAKVVGKPTAKVLRRCIKVTCQDSSAHQ